MRPDGLSQSNAISQILPEKVLIAGEEQLDVASLSFNVSARQKVGLKKGVTKTSSERLSGREDDSTSEHRG